LMTKPIQGIINMMRSIITRARCHGHDKLIVSIQTNLLCWLAAVNIQFSLTISIAPNGA
jgi:hypothetical protein